ncbi:MAG: CoA ester lyase [Micromonosporaceae bacterium]|nr:CoA ester lyase [Micromonosporaceae bacterium]
MPEPPVPLRSYLYAPGSRPELLGKAYAAGADAVVYDLEDAVPADRKEAARVAVARQLGQVAATAARGPQVHVRVNPARDGYDRADLAAVVVPGLDALRLPKAADPQWLRALAAELDELEARAGLPAGHVALYPTVESAAGVLRAGELAGAGPRVARLAFGAADFLTDIGAGGPAHGPATLAARGQLVLASRAAGIGAPVDSVHTIVDDPAGLREGAIAARQLGFFGKAVIHPAQLPVVHEVFTPDDRELAWARRVTAAGGNGTVDGEFVDRPALARARSLLALARTLATEDTPATKEDER